MTDIYKVEIDGFVFDVELISDYNIKGSFHPDAACDLEYYGYRETEFNVLSVKEEFNDVGLDPWIPVDYNPDEIVSFYKLRLELELQYLIDKENGEV